jgi:hypothetical protein
MGLPLQEGDQSVRFGGCGGGGNGLGAILESPGFSSFGPSFGGLSEIGAGELAAPLHPRDRPLRISAKATG